MFEELGGPLPLATRLALQRWPILLGAVVSTGLLIAGGVGPGRMTLAVRRLVMLAAFGVSGLMVAATVAALYLPVVQLTSAVQTFDSPIELPRAAAPADESVVVGIQPDGALVYQGDPIDPPTLRARLATQAERNPRTRVVIAADRNVRHGTVLDIMDLVRQHGMRVAASVD